MSLLQTIIRKRDDARTALRKWQQVLDLFESDPDLALLVHDRTVKVMNGARVKLGKRKGMSAESRAAMSERMSKMWKNPATRKKLLKGLKVSRSKQSAKS